MNNDIIKYWATITESTYKQGYKNNFEYALDNDRDLSDADKLVVSFWNYLVSTSGKKSMDDISLTEFAMWLVQKPDNNIQYESRVNEVSDIDVDWDDETLKNKEREDYEDSSRKYIGLDNDDFISLCGILEECVDWDKIKEWLEFWKTHEPANKKVAEYLKARIKSRNTRENTRMIQKIKDQEGV